MWPTNGDAEAAATLPASLEALDSPLARFALSGGARWRHPHSSCSGASAGGRSHVGRGVRQPAKMRSDLGNYSDDDMMEVV